MGREKENPQTNVRLAEQRAQINTTAKQGAGITEISNVISEDTVSVEIVCQNMVSELSFSPDFLLPHTLIINKSLFRKLFKLSLGAWK